MIPTEKLLELKELSEKATQGEWKYEKLDDNFVNDLNGKTLFMSRYWREKGAEDYQFVASANPTTILELIGEVIKARKIISRIQDYGPSEPSNNNACWFCDMGGAGYSSKGANNHDDDCLWCKSRDHQSKYGDGK